MFVHYNSKISSSYFPHLFLTLKNLFILFMQQHFLNELSWNNCYIFNSVFKVFWEFKRHLYAFLMTNTIPFSQFFMIRKLKYLKTKLSIFNSLNFQREICIHPYINSLKLYIFRVSLTFLYKMLSGNFFSMQRMFKK